MEETACTSDALRRLTDRGLVRDCTNFAELDEALGSGTVAAYAGFDATADSLHVGHLVLIMTMRWLQKCGHKPIILVGGGTTRVGDPSFRTTTRPILSDEKIASNVASLKTAFAKFITFGDGPTDAIMVNNDDWLRDVHYVDFLREVGRHFTVNRMVAMDMVKTRLEDNISLSFLEFNYPLLQAFDFLKLCENYNCTLQVGGSDQWGNIVGGVELIRRKISRTVFGLTTPLLTTHSGEKMGKTAGGAVWLNADRLSPFDYWQFWRNVDDGNLNQCLKLFTELPIDEIDAMTAHQSAEINNAKIVLATQATAMLHGQEEALAAEQAARKIFGEGTVAEGMPTVRYSHADLEAGVQVIDILQSLEFTTSRKEGKRAIQGGGVRLNGVVVTSLEETVTLDALTEDNSARIALGKKKIGSVALD